MAKDLSIAEIDALPLGPADRARLKAHYGYDAGEQSRPAEAYDGAKLKPWGKARGDAASGKVQPAGAPAKFSAANTIGGAQVVGTPAQLQAAAAKGYVDQSHADGAWAETTGGAIAGKPAPSTKLAYSAEVPKAGGGTSTLYLSSAKPDEVETLVRNGTVSRETADRIYAAKNAGDPMQKLVSKTAPAPGMDYATKATSVDPSAYDAPLPAGKPLTSAALPGAPAPVKVSPGPQMMADGATVQPEGAYGAEVSALIKKKAGK